MANKSAQEMLSVRGLSLDTVKAYRIGWNARDIYDNRQEWGLPIELKDSGMERTQWLPKGIVIPAFDNGIPVKIKIRRTDWLKSDKLPKYVEVSGGQQRPVLYGDSSKPFVVLESELDAILIQQFASDVCCCVALGGVGKRPDKHLHDILQCARVILLSLDYDEAGIKEYSFWMSNYRNSRPWPASKGKSPGDSYKLYSVDLRQWVLEGLDLKN